MISPRKRFGLIAVGLAVILAIIQTRLFGGHWFPNSYSEAIVDGICLMLCAYGVSLTDEKLNNTIDNDNIKDKNEI